MWWNIKVSFLLLLTIIGTGCFSVEKGRLQTTGEEHVLVSNYGWYLFHFIPLACGNACEERYTPWVIFRNDVTMDKIQSRFFSYVDSQKDVKPVSVSYRTRETVLFEFPGSNIPIPLPYIFTYKEIQLSGVLASKKEEAK